LFLLGLRMIVVSPAKGDTSSIISHCVSALGNDQ
jgi:hypothetical protein